MKIAELALTISNRTGVEPQAVQNVLEATFALLGEELNKDRKIELQGLGIFVRKQNGKSEKQGKTLFKSWSAKGANTKKREAAKGGKKRKRKTRKTKKESFP